MDEDEVLARTQFARALMSLRKVRGGWRETRVRRVWDAAGICEPHSVYWYGTDRYGNRQECARLNGAATHICTSGEGDMVSHRCFSPASGPDQTRLLSIIGKLLDCNAVICSSCSQVTVNDAGHEGICSACFVAYFSRCDDCHVAVRSHRMTRAFLRSADTDTVESVGLCNYCVHNNSSYCNQCGRYWRREYTERINSDDDAMACIECAENLPTCEFCDYRYTGRQRDHGCYRNCRCTPERMNFSFPTENGSSSVMSDTIVVVSTPSGMVDERGMEEIATRVYDAMTLVKVGEVVTSRAGLVTRSVRDAVSNLNTSSWEYLDPAAARLASNAQRAIGDMDPTWQTKDGNLPKRVQKILYKNYSFKASVELIASIGTIAKAHTNTQSEQRVEMSRLLNESADHWYHEDSCWWGGYAYSRCRFKGVGGLGMRVFDDVDDLLGRVWLIPLDGDLRATQDTMGAHAYIAFNAYGIDGYTAARILATMTGKSYRKIRFESSDSDMFVNRGKNGTSGYLIAAQDVCNEVSELSIIEMSDAKHGVVVAKQQRTAA